MSSEKNRAVSPSEIPAIRNGPALILESRTFRAAEGQRAFLRYIVQETIAGRGADLKEYSIGTQALGRAETFDPRTDPIVRTQARKLRAHLAEYYQNEGVDDPIRIELPKGGYLPLFEPTVSTPLQTAIPDPEPVAQTESASVQPAPSKRILYAWGAIAIARTRRERTGRRCMH